LGHEVFTVGPTNGVWQDVSEPDKVVCMNGDQKCCPSFFYYDAKKIVAKHGSFDAIVQVEPGILLYNLGEVLVPSCYWGLDDYLAVNSPWLERIGGGKDYFEQLGINFHGKYGAVCALKAAGINTEFLPYGVDPEFYMPVKTKKIYDVVFIGVMGSELYHWRQILLDSVASKYNVWFGEAWDDEYCLKYSQAKLGLDLQMKGEMGRRFFEVMAVGTCMLSNIKHGQEIMGFNHGEHLVNYTYHTIDWEIAKYLQLSEEREHIAKVGREKVLAEHTYVNRAKTILEDLTGED